MSRRPPPERADAPLRWLGARQCDLAPLTGTDTKALLAIAYCWRLYAYTRSPGVLDAIRNLLREMQPKCAPLTRDLIAWAMDWSDREKLWPIVWGGNIRNGDSQ